MADVNKLINILIGGTLTGIIVLCAVMPERADKIVFTIGIIFLVLMLLATALIPNPEG